jgi:hypothetical protein
MCEWERARAEFRQQNRGIRPQYPESMHEEHFKDWLPTAIDLALTAGEAVDNDVKALMIPPSRDAKSYRSMYTYGNHIRVRGAEVDLSTCDSGVAATFSQSCRISTRDRNMRMANLEYIGWVDEILGVDYGAFELILLYCTWIHATTTEARATMKRDEYGFTLLKVDRVIPYSVDSFAIPLHVQQVFFPEEVGNPGWKVVL